MYFYDMFKIDFSMHNKPIDLSPYLLVFGALIYLQFVFKINVLNLYQLKIAESSTGSQN